MVGQSQAGENDFHFLVYIPAAEAFDASLQARHFVKPLALFDPGAPNEAAVSAENRAPLPHPADARCHYLENSLCRVGRHFLFQMSNAQAISAPDLSFIRSGGSPNEAK